MAQVSLSNISLSFLKEQFNITGAISFSDLYNYTTDIPYDYNISVSDFIGSYRNFIPTDLSGLVNWYDTSLLFLDGYENNTTVELLKDLSGNNNNATQTSENNRPVYFKNAVNNRPGLLFKDQLLTNSKYLNFNTISQPTELTIGVVFNTTTNRSNYIISNNTWASGSIIIEHSSSRTNNIILNTTLNKNNNTTSFVTQDYVPILYIIKIYLDGSDFKSQLRYNGIDGPIYTHDNSLTNLELGSGMMLGGNPTFISNNLNGYLSEIVIYNRKLTNDETYILEGYLASKWWGVPSYLLPSTHKFYKIPVLNTLNSPSLLYIFEQATHTSNIITLKNYGLEANLLDGIVDNMEYNLRSTYYTGFNNHLDHLFIWYKFDSINNLIYVNNGFGGSIYDLINPVGKISYTTDYIRGDGCLNLDPTDISTTNTTTNLINFNSFASEYTLAFWYKVDALTGSNDTLFSLSGSPNNGSRFYIQRDSSTNNIIVGLPYTTETIRIYNSIFSDNVWRHIAVCLKKINTGDLLLSVYLNGLAIYYDYTLINSWFSASYTNYIVINQYSTGTGLYSGFGADMLYDDFRLYTKSLNEKEVQAIMGYPISLQSGVRNTNGYFWNSYDTNITPNLDVSYTSFINFFFQTNNIYTISYNLQLLKDSLYTTDYEIIILHCNDNNLDKLKIVHRYNSGTSYIKIIVSDTTTTNDTTQYFENLIADNLLHNYIFTVPINLGGPNTINLYTDGVLTNSAATTSSEPIINNQFVKVGTYNDGVATLNVAPFMLEDLRIYKREIGLNEVHYINSNYNVDREYLYYESNLYPFTYLKFTYSYAESNAYGPTYSNIILNYSSNGSWVFDLDYLNSFNGIQQFTVPYSGYYHITCAGACGGSSYTTTEAGKGIVVSNIAYLNTNEILNILVGQKGGTGKYVIRPNEYDLHGQGGGGGFTSVIRLNDDPILIAGGGGGSGETMTNGENAVGTDAVNTTYSASDSENYATRSDNGNGGNIGLFGLAKGSGCGGGGLLEDGKNKISIYNGEYKGIGYVNIKAGSNIGRPFYQNVGGIGGFPGGATGGTNYSLDLVWGPGGGGGYSGGPGGSAGYFQGQTLGAGGGGSYDINGILNHATLNRQEGTLGYNCDNGYVKLRFLTSDHFKNYANATKKLSYDGLTLLLEPGNSISYDQLNTPSSMINLIDGTYASLNDSYSYVENSIRLFNTSSLHTTNKSYLHVNSHSDIRTVSIWYYVHTVPPNNSFFIDSFNDFGYITDTVVGADWYDGFNDIPHNQGGTMYIDSSNQALNINWEQLIYPINTWRNVTFISHSNLSNELAIFGNEDGNSGLNVEFGPIMIYDRVINFDDHLYNFRTYTETYLNKYIFEFIGVLQYFRVPDNVNNIFVKMWSSGGGGSRNVQGNGYGGGGAFISTTLTVIPGEILTITVGSGGFPGKNNSRSIGGWPTNTSGEGGYESGAGGGITSIQRENNEYMVIAASGSGSGYFYGTYDAINTTTYVQSQVCGAGGGDLVNGNAPTIESGNPGTTSAGGLAYTTLFNNTVAAENGKFLEGADGGTNFGGGSGASYWSGSGGGERSDFVAGGASGTSYCNPLYCNNNTVIAGNNGNINNGEAVNKTDEDYPTYQISQGGAAGNNNGGNGYVVFKLLY